MFHGGPPGMQGGMPPPGMGKSVGKVIGRVVIFCRVFGFSHIPKKGGQNNAFKMLLAIYLVVFLKVTGKYKKSMQIRTQHYESLVHESFRC